jgi:hypothetical protein
MPQTNLKRKYRKTLTRHFSSLLSNTLQILNAKHNKMNVVHKYAFLTSENRNLYLGYVARNGRMGGKVTFSEENK